LTKPDDSDGRPRTDRTVAEEMLQEYEPGKDMGQDWYVRRIAYLIDQIRGCLQVTPPELWLIKRSLLRLIVSDNNQWLVNKAQELLDRLIDDHR